MKESKPKLTFQFTPEYDFMNDPKLREVHQCLYDCYYGMEPETQNERDSARAKFTILWSEIFSKYSKTKANRALLIKFLRKNFRILDAGGIAKGNDPQINALKSANEHLFTNYNAEYLDLVKTIEK